MTSAILLRPLLLQGAGRSLVAGGHAAAAAGVLGRGHPELTLGYRLRSGLGQYPALPIENVVAGLVSLAASPLVIGPVRRWVVHVLGGGHGRSSSDILALSGYAALLQLIPGNLTTPSTSENGRVIPAAVRCLSIQELPAASLTLLERGRWLGEFLLLSQEYVLSRNAVNICRFKSPGIAVGVPWPRAAVAWLCLL